METQLSNDSAHSQIWSQSSEGKFDKMVKYENAEISHTRNSSKVDGIGAPINSQQKHERCNSNGSTNVTKFTT